MWDADAFQRASLALHGSAETHAILAAGEPGFTPRMNALLEDYLQHRADIIIDIVVERGSCKFLTDPDRYMDITVEENVRCATPVLNFRFQGTRDADI